MYVFNFAETCIYINWNIDSQPLYNGSTDVLSKMLLISIKKHSMQFIKHS